MAGGNSIPLVKELRHPILERPYASDVVAFISKYDAYMHQVEELNAGRPTSQHMKPTGREFCLNPSLAEQMVALKVFDKFSNDGPVKGVEDLSDGLVGLWLESRCEVDERDMAARVKLALRDVKFQVNKSDAEGSALMFFADVGRKLKENGCSAIAKTQGKKLIYDVMALVQPKLVRDLIEDEWSYKTPKERSDYFKFQTLVIQRVKESARWEGIKRQIDSDTAGEKEGPPIKKRKENKKGGKTGSLNPKTEERKSKMSLPWTKKCLNEECDGVHRLSACPNTSKEKKTELFKKFYEDNKKGSLKAVRTIVLQNADGNFESSRPNGRWRAILGDATEVVAKGDSGADWSCIPRSVLKGLTQNGVRPQETELVIPIDLEQATKSKAHTKARCMVKADVTLHLNCAPLRLRNTEWLVVEDDMSEVLLGNPLLKALGFDLDAHLETNRDGLHDRSFDTGLLKDVNSAACLSGKAARVSCYSGMTSASADSDPVQPVPTAGAAMGEDSDHDIREAFRTMLENAKTQGMTDKGLAVAEKLLNEFRDIFRIKLGKDDPARIAPMEVKLKAGAKPVRSNQRRYAPAQRAFLSTTIKKLEDLGAVRANPTSKWASPALAVPKAGSEGFRFTVDLRRANEQVQPMASSMPHLESLFQTVSGAMVFSKIDLCHAYWQIALAAESQEIFSIQTPLGIYTPTRLIQGSTDAGNYFQGTTEPLFSQEPILQSKLLQWLDDFMMYAKSEEELLVALRTFFVVCRRYGLKVNALKTDLFGKEAHFCGRIFDKDGMRFHPSKFESLRTMQRPELAADLLQFTFALNWMRSSIPDYSELAAPLLELLELCYKEVGGRTKKKLGKLSLTSRWGTGHQASFDGLKQALEDQIKLAYPKPDYDMVLCTDASESHWSGVLTQVRKSERHLPVQEQRHEPLGFVSGSFKKAAFSWATVEKEAYAVVESFERFEYLVGGREVSLYTDHANLIYIFDPIGQNPGIARHTASKLTRWAVKLSSFRYVIEAIPGEYNHMADLLTRWAIQPRRVISRISKVSVVHAPIAPQDSATPEWPGLNDIIRAQRNTTESKPDSCQIDKRGATVFESGVLWIPDADKEMQLRLLIAAHAGLGGHRGAATTMRGMTHFVRWTTMEEDVKSFVGTCIHCLSTTTGGKVPRPTAQTLHATKPNKMLHMDFLYIYPGVEGYEYVLVLKDDFSSYVRLVKCKAADAESTVKGLIDWFSTFGVVLEWVSDRGTHFKNDVMKMLREQNHAAHRFTLAYAPWSNGTVEVVNREVLRVLRALCSEMRIAFKEWPNILPVVQGALNSAAVPRLGDLAPLTVMTNLPADVPLASVVTSIDEHPRVVNPAELKSLQKDSITSAVEAVRKMHKKVGVKQTASRQSKIRAHNRKTNVKPCNFIEGDFVLRGVRVGQHRSKLALRWTGPYRVVKVLSDYVFVLEHLLTGKTVDVHGTRIILFRNSSFGETQEMRDHILHQEGELYNVERFLGFRNHQGVPQVRVSWQGLDLEDDTWEDVKQIKEDVPVLFEKYLEDCRRIGTARDKGFIRTNRL